MDAEAIRSLEEKGKLEQSIKRRNFILFYGLIVGCLLILFLRAGYLQVVKGEYYYNLAQGNSLRIYYTPAPRGMIYDRFREPLVYNIPSFDLLVDVVDFLDNPLEVQEDILAKVVSVVEARSDLLSEKIEESRGQTTQLVLLKNIERSSALALESMVQDWQGIRLEKNAQRQYALGPYFAHILGYTGQVDQSDLEIYDWYSINDEIGKAGLERQYEDVLRGEQGQEQFEVNSLGKIQRLIAVKSSQPGQGLILSIDSKLQKKLYQSLNEMLDKLSKPRDKISRAVGVAINPKDGSVLALVSLPSFDNNLFAQGISETDLTALNNDPNEPFLNRATAGQYPPGSTIKPLIAAAALKQGVVKSSKYINCHGSISIPHKYNPEIVYYYPDWKAHGPTNIIKAIAESCNVFFYALGGGYGQIEGLGIERIKKYLQYFGFGQATRIDLPQDGTGLIPDEKWKTENFGEEWYLGDTYNLSIGQGDVLATPLQMTLAIASIANGGILYQPRIVDKIIDSEDMPAKIIQEGFIDSDIINVVKKGMRQAVLTGSARALADLPIKAAGKTGTAQFGTKGQTHAWFIGFAPYEDPQIVLTVLVEGGGEGNQAAVPVAKEVFKWYFEQ